MVGVGKPNLVKRLGPSFMFSVCARAKPFNKLLAKKVVLGSVNQKLELVVKYTPF